MPETVRLETIERITNSKNGNPRFLITWSTKGWESYHSARTAPDADLNYDIGNKGYRPFDLVTIGLNGRDQIVEIEPAS